MTSVSFDCHPVIQINGVAFAVPDDFSECLHELCRRPTDIRLEGGIAGALMSAGLVDQGQGPGWTNWGTDELRNNLKAIEDAAKKAVEKAERRLKAFLRHHEQQQLATSS